MSKPIALIPRALTGIGRAAALARDGAGIASKRRLPPLAA